MKNRFIYGTEPKLNYRRNKFGLSHNSMTSFNLGDLVPIDCQEVLPGDNWKQDVSVVVRTTSAFARPVMGDLYMDLYSFFVPSRLLQDNYTDVFGNSNTSAWNDAPLGTVAKHVGSFTNVSGTVADHLGIPLGSNSYSFSVLPFRAFAMIYNEWFRNQNVQDETYINKNDYANSAEHINNNGWSPTNYFGKLPKITKFKDIFTSCLPKPQKGEASMVDVALTGLVPTISHDQFYTTSDVAPHMIRSDGIQANGALGASDSGFLLSDGEGGYYGDNAYIDNLWADFDSDDSQVNAGINVSDLRTAFALQKMLEKDARYGGRYREYLLGHYGVSNGDARMQVPEYLSGDRIRLNIEQVVQNNTMASSGGTVESPLGSLGAYSLTGHAKGCKFKKAFTEHGYIMTVAAIRQKHVYSNGLAKMWTRFERNDFYDPLFANLSEQPIYLEQLDANGVNTEKSTVFGYNEAWVEYRSIPNMVTGKLRDYSSNGLSIWTLADKYDQENQPTLSSSFIDETNLYLNGKLTAPTLDNFICDFYFNTEAVRVMPLYSKPGLIDHH